MVRTIYVIFTEKKLSHVTSKYKKYMFLCPYDSLRVGDMIEDKRYTTPMQIVTITNDSSPIQTGISLKTISPSKINGAIVVDYTRAKNHVYNQTNNNNMETRNISVTLKQAREWYVSGNSTLRTLALNAYSEKELTLSYEHIASIESNNLGSCSVLIPYGSHPRFKVLAKLQTIARYFNGSWEMGVGREGFFLGKSTFGVEYGSLSNNIRVLKHESVMYSGIVYFGSAEDCLKAGELLGDDIKYLF